jgi:uncharacterized protein (TIGR02271 family)
VVGVFTDPAQARAAVDELRRARFREDQIGVVTRDHAAADPASPDKATGSLMGEGAAVGAAAGLGVGALWAVGMATIALPPLLPAVLVSSWLVSILASAGAGAAIAGLAGALIGLGIPEHEAQYYEEEFKSGRTLVTVRVENRYQEARDILRGHGAYDHETRTASMTEGRVAGDKKVKVHEEKLNVRKEPVKTGEVRVHKEIVTENKTLNVPVTREEVVIERRPVSGAASTSDLRAGEEVRIPVKEEKVHVTKEAVVTEEVTVGKRKVTENKQVGGTVRKEKVHVEEKGDVDVKHRKK